MAAFSTPVLTVFHQGQVASGAKVYTYVTGTTTPLTTYANAALSTPNGNPVTANANGQVTLYIPTTAAMKAVLYTATGEYIDTIDPIYPTANFTSGITSEAVLPSAATTDLGSTGANLIRVTGSTTITSLGASATTGNPIYYVRFAGSLMLTHNATSLILPGSANITTSAGANAIFQYLGDGNWACLFYQTADGSSLLPAAQTLLSTQVASNDASIVFTGLGSIYREYVIRFTGLRAQSTGGALRFRVSEDNGATWKSGGSDYQYSTNYLQAGGSPTALGSSAESHIEVMNVTAITAAHQGCGEITLSNPSVTTLYKQVRFRAGTKASTNRTYDGDGYYIGSTAAVNAVQLYIAGENIGAGIFELWGIT